MVRPTLRPLEQRPGVNYDPPFRIKTGLRTVHRSRRGTFEVNPLAVVTTAVTWTLELVFGGFPVGRTAEVRAARIDHKQSVGGARDPDTILLLPLSIDADRVIARRADTKDTGRFDSLARQEKPHEHQQDGGERARNRRPDDPPTHFIDGRIVRRGFNHFRFCRRSLPNSSRHVYGCGWRSRGCLIGLTIQVKTSVTSIPYVRALRLRRYTSTSITESRLYNSASYRDLSLRRKTNYLLNHEERRAYQNKYNVVGVTFITFSRKAGKQFYSTPR